MPRTYSNDLRRKFLQAYEEGEGTLEELAEQFRVSLGWAKKISARRSRTGEVDAPVWRHGPVSRVTPAVQAEAQPVRLSLGRMWLALRQLGLPLKKKRSTRKSRIASKRSAGGKPGEKR
jgi:transposase